MEDNNNSNEFWNNPEEASAFAYEDDGEQKKSKREKNLEKVEERQDESPLAQEQRRRRKTAFLVMARVALCIIAVGVVGYMTQSRIISASNLRGVSASYVWNDTSTQTQPGADDDYGDLDQEYKYIDTTKLDSMSPAEVAEWYKKHFPENEEINKTALEEYNRWLTGKTKNVDYKKAYYDALESTVKPMNTKELEAMSADTLAVWYQERFAAPQNLETAKAEHEEFMAWYKTRVADDPDFDEEFKMIVYDTMGETALSNPFASSEPIPPEPFDETRTPSKETETGEGTALAGAQETTWQEEDVPPASNTDLKI